MDIVRTHREIAEKAPPPRATGAGSHTLRVESVLPPGWAGRVAAGLAARRISIVRGRARRQGPVFWVAELEIEPPPGVQVEEIDLVALASAPERSAGSIMRVALTRFRLEERPGELVVEIRARDQVGLLGRLLGVFAMFALFPHEMEIDTRDGEAVDVFRLRALGDRAPPASLAVALRSMLERLAAG